MSQHWFMLLAILEPSLSLLDELTAVTKRDWKQHEERIKKDLSVLKHKLGESGRR
jgi:hypothetical protein